MYNKSSSIFYPQSLSLSKRINTVLITESELLADELSNHAKEANELIKAKKPVPDQLWVNLELVGMECRNVF